MVKLNFIQTRVCTYKWNNKLPAVSGVKDMKNEFLHVGYYVSLLRDDPYFNWDKPQYTGYKSISEKARNLHYAVILVW